MNGQCYSKTYIFENCDIYSPFIFIIKSQFIIQMMNYYRCWPATCPFMYSGYYAEMCSEDVSTVLICFFLSPTKWVGLFLVFNSALIRQINKSIDGTADDEEEGVQTDEAIRAGLELLKVNVWGTGTWIYSSFNTVVISWIIFRQFSDFF